MFFKLIIALTPMVLALPFAMDIYVPAIPHIARVFHANDTQMLYTLNGFMLSAGLMQLIIGPLSDHYGRRRVGLVMIACFAVSSFFCGLSQNVWQLFGFRMIQALGSCGMMVLGFAMVRDSYSGDQSVRAYSFLTGLISFSPIFATFIGSYLDLYLGWSATFGFLLLIALPAIGTIGFWLKETLPVEQRTVLSTNLFSQYAQVLRNKTFQIYALASAFGHCYLYLFCALSPYLIMRTLGIPQAEYGFYFCFMGVSVLIGSMLCSALVERLHVFKSCLVGYVITLLGGVWMWLWYVRDGLSVYNFVFPMVLIGIGGTFCMGAGAGGAMDPFDEGKGVAAAARGAIQFLFAGVAGYFLINRTVDSTLPLAIPAVCFSLIGIASLLIYRQSALRSPVIDSF